MDWEGGGGGSSWGLMGDFGGKGVGFGGGCMWDGRSRWHLVESLNLVQVSIYMFGLRGNVWKVTCGWKLGEIRRNAVLLRIAVIMDWRLYKCSGW